MNAQVVCVLWLATAAVAQSQWSLQGGAARVHVTGPVAQWLQGPHATATGLPAGDYDVHFGADADGKPRSLHLRVPDGAAVFVATAAAAPAAGERVELPGPPGSVRCAGAAADTGYRVVADVVAASEGAVDLVARCRGEAQFYRFVADRPANEFRLERALGGEPLVLARAPMPAADSVAHTMALQASGFRLQASWDEAVVLQVLDGGLSAGAFGSSAFAHVTRQPIAEPRASSALVVTTTGAELTAAVTVVPDHLYSVELTLDRAHPPLPSTEGGGEPWLLLPPAAPVVMQADWRGSLGPGGLGRVSVDGTLACELQLPPRLALRKQVALVRAVLAAPDGSQIVGCTPALPLRLP